MYCKFKETGIYLLIIPWLIRKRELIEKWQISKADGANANCYLIGLECH